MNRLTLCLSALVVFSSQLIQAADKEAKTVVAVYQLNGPLSESGQVASGMFDLSFKTALPMTMLDLSRSLEKALADDAVKAVVIDADQAQVDFSQIQEIRKLLLALRDGGKDVWMYSEHLSNRTALLGSAANHFALMPEADCDFHGIYAESMYFKGLLDKLGVKADVIHIGDFKSYGENFYRSGPSEFALKQEETLIDSIYGQIVSQVAEGRKLKPEEVQTIIDDGTLTAKEAVELKLADALMYRTEFVKKLRETYGDTAKFDRNYELPDLEGPQIDGVMDVIKLMFSEANKGKFRKDFIAVVALDGDISEESIAPVRTQILRLAKEPKAKALVLRVNSPGGSALASEVLWEATQEWKTTGKPFIVSMGGVAASGGYYVSCGADRIFAEEGTITGSIGVVGMKFVVGDAMEKIGITTHAIQRGKNAGSMSMMHGFSTEEATIVRTSMTKTYETFKKRVSDGRGKALRGDLESLAGGRVCSGKAALGVGLIDEIGGLHDAIAYAASQLKMVNPDVKLLPEPKSALEGLFAKPDKNDDQIIHVSTYLTRESSFGNLLKASGMLKALPASAQKSVNRLATRFEAFKNCRVLLLGPDFDFQ